MSFPSRIVSWAPSTRDLNRHFLAALGRARYVGVFGHVRRHGVAQSAERLDSFRNFIHQLRLLVMVLVEEQMQVIKSVTRNLPVVFFYAWSRRVIVSARIWFNRSTLSPANRLAQIHWAILAIVPKAWISAATWFEMTGRDTFRFIVKRPVVDFLRFLFIFIFRGHNSSPQLLFQRRDQRFVIRHAVVPRSVDEKAGRAVDAAPDAAEAVFFDAFCQRPSSLRASRIAWMPRSNPSSLAQAGKNARFHKYVCLSSGRIVHLPEFSLKARAASAASVAIRAYVEVRLRQRKVSEDKAQFLPERLLQLFDHRISSATERALIIAVFNERQGHFGRPLGKWSRERYRAG